MALPPAGSLDDSYSAIKIMDFAGGLVTTAASTSLASNQSPDMLNCIPLPGRLIFRGGYSDICDLPAKADQAYVFYDLNHVKHYAIWSDGTLYDCVSGVAVPIDIGSYTAGVNVGCVDFNGKLYWSCGYPNQVPLRYWDPVAGTTAPVTTSGSPGSVDPPSSDFLFMYTGSTVALAPYWGAGGSPPASNVYQPNVFCWCNTNDPTTWIAANAQASGTLNSGRLEYGRQFGISAAGVSPEEVIIIARNDIGIYAYQGALGQLSEKLLNCPFGIQDRFSAQYLPTQGSFGEIVFVATDGEIWGTNGITAYSLSDNILPSVQTAFAAALNAGAKHFYSGYNQQWQYYYVDYNGVQFGYRWSTKAWFPLFGWPSGPSFNSFDTSGIPGMFIASIGPFYSNPFVLGSSILGGTDVISSPALVQVGQMATADNGVMPSVYYKTPILHAGDLEMWKEWHWGCITTYDTGATYNLDAQSNRRSDGTIMVANTVPLISPAFTGIGNPFILNVSTLGGANTLGAPQGTLGTPVTMQERFAVPVPEDEWTIAGKLETLKGTGIQMKVSWGGGNPVFDLLAIEVLYVPRGYLRGAGTLYNPENLTGQPFDPWTNTPSG